MQAEDPQIYLLSFFCLQMAEENLNSDQDDSQSHPDNSKKDVGAYFQYDATENMSK